MTEDQPPDAVVRRAGECLVARPPARSWTPMPSEPASTLAEYATWDEPSAWVQTPDEER